MEGSTSSLYSCLLLCETVTELVTMSNHNHYSHLLRDCSRLLDCSTSLRRLCKRKGCNLRTPCSEYEQSQVLITPPSPPPPRSLWVWQRGLRAAGTWRRRTCSAGRTANEAMKEKNGLGLSHLLLAMLQLPAQLPKTQWSWEGPGTFIMWAANGEDTEMAPSHNQGSH